MGLDREFVILVVAGLLGLAVVAVAGVEHLVLGGVLVAMIAALALFLALARFGPDRVPLETYILRRLAWARSARRYTFVRGVEAPAAPPAQMRPRQQSRPPVLRPVTWAPSPSAAYGAAVGLALVVSGYFLVWLQTGGAAELADVWRMILGGRP